MLLVEKNDMATTTSARGPPSSNGIDHRHHRAVSRVEPIVKENQSPFEKTFGDGPTLPTEEELRTLRRVPAKIPWKIFTIAFIELVERLSYYGTLAVATNFIQQPNPGTATGRPLKPGSSEAQPGALGLGQRTATALSTFNKFWVYLMPLFGAYVADTYLGRFKTVLYAAVVAEIGHIVLVISALPSMLKKPHGALGAYTTGLVVMGIGTGFFKPNISPLVAEQIVQGTLSVSTTKRGERIIVDPFITAGRIYSYFYMFINIGALVGQISMVYCEKYVGFYLSFLIPTLFFLTTFPVLLYCRKRYKVHPPEGSVLGPAIRLLLLGLKKRLHWNPIATWRHLNDGTYWHCVKPSYLGSSKPAWMKFDDAWVDEVARGWHACSVFLWYPWYLITYNQIASNLTSQAASMALHGVPNDVIGNIDPLAIMILVPLMDLVIFPFLRKRGIVFSPIKKITAGFWLGTLAMIWSCALQYRIYKSSPCGHKAGSKCKAPITVWDQTGAYVLVAASEILASVTSLEYAYTKAPKNMRSLVQAFALFMSAISAAIGFALVPLSGNPLLVWNYGGMAIISFIGGVLFYLTYRRLDQAEDQLNMLPSGRMDAQQEDNIELEYRNSTSTLSISREKH